MSLETSNTTPTVNSKPVQSSIAAEQVAKPQVQLQTAAAPKAESHVCCHTAGVASPAASVGSPRAGEAAGLTPAAHGCTAHKSADSLQSLGKESSDAARRTAATVATDKSANHTAASLIAGLRNTDADAAREAATALGALGDPSAVEPLISVIRNADGYFHPVVRIAATASLGQLRDARAFEPLVPAISDPVAEASAEAIRSLTALGDPRGVAALLTVMRNENGFFLPATRHAAALGLAKLGGAQAEFELKFIASNEFEDTAIRDVAAQAIGAGAKTAAVHGPH